eukprot:9850460-Alexandrium_andersonii.AAC.1
MFHPCCARGDDGTEVGIDEISAEGAVEDGDVAESVDISPACGREAHLHVQHLESRVASQVRKGACARACACA